MVGLDFVAQRSQMTEALMKKGASKMKMLQYAMGKYWMYFWDDLWETSNYLPVCVTVKHSLAEKVGLECVRLSESLLLKCLFVSAS